MIVRVLGEGQFRVADESVAEFNGIDETIEQAVDADDQQALTAALEKLRAKVAGSGQPVPDDQLEDSDLILPGADATLSDVRRLLQDTDEGLIPG